ncbi:MAG: CPBP family glutamic-type intramembrane protease [Planctomycetota bacterium]
MRPKKESRKVVDAPVGGYFRWSRAPEVAMLAVLPVWIAYEALRLYLTPNERNGAEALVLSALRFLGPHGLDVLRVALGITFLVSIVFTLRQRIPWLQVAFVVALEGVLYGLLLGPVSQALTFFWLDRGVLLSWPWTASELTGSLGAGIFEEALFRLGILSVLLLLAGRATRSLGVSRTPGVALAVLISALTFSGFHHFGAGAEPFDSLVFLFRAMAGLVLGALFLARGFAVVVYTHAVYDLYFYATQPAAN